MEILELNIVIDTQELVIKQVGQFPQIGTVVDFRPLFVKFHIC